MAETRMTPRRADKGLIKVCEEQGAGREAEI